VVNLVVDAGNTSVKLGLFEGNNLLTSKTINSLIVSELSYFLSDYPKPEHAIFSSVRRQDNLLQSRVNDAVGSSLELTHETRIPIVNSYQTPETLGKDRLAGVVGANFLYPNTNLLVVDAGTAVTYDVITAQGEFLGGNISPGLRTRFAALHQLTGRLPLCEPEVDFKLLGRTTQEAIVGGVQNGLLYEIQANIDQFSLKYSNLCVILTGGDALFLANRLKTTIFVVCNLVLIGLNRILINHARLE
jgi:type III pantothenate kinase